MPTKFGCTSHQIHVKRDRALCQKVNATAGNTLNNQARLFSIFFSSHSDRNLSTESQSSLSAFAYHDSSHFLSFLHQLHLLNLVSYPSYRYYRNQIQIFQVPHSLSIFHILRLSRSPTTITIFLHLSTAVPSRVKTIRQFSYSSSDFYTPFKHHRHQLYSSAYPPIPTQVASLHRHDNILTAVIIPFKFSDFYSITTYLPTPTTLSTPHILQ